MPNRRQGMILFGLWLTKAERESMKESLKDLNRDQIMRDFAIQNIVEIIEKANERGDFIKK